VVSPALANLYINRMLKGFRQTRRGEQFRARIVNYADAFVILSRGKAKEALEWTRGVLERLELTLNEKKTSIRNASREQFHFLGYTFGPHYSMRTGRQYIGYSPSKKSVARIKQNVGDLLVPSNGKPWAEVRDRLNQKLQGWRAYFGCGSTAKAYRAVDEFVYDAVRHFLRRRHKVSSQGTRQFPEERVFGSLGVIRLQGPMGTRL
jgi:RNA-directed DNA polymerase